MKIQIQRRSLGNSVCQQTVAVVAHKQLFLCSQRPNGQVASLAFSSKHCYWTLFQIKALYEKNKTVTVLFCFYAFDDDGDASLKLSTNMETTACSQSECSVAFYPCLRTQHRFRNRQSRKRKTTFDTGGGENGKTHHLCTAGLWDRASFQTNNLETETGVSSHGSSSIQNTESTTGFRHHLLFHELNRNIG